MPFHEKDASRLRRLLEDREDVVEKKMFGGVCFMVSGHMCIGLANDDLMVRTGPEAHAKALEMPHARPMDFTGKPLNGLVFVDPAGWDTKPKLQQWLELALEFVISLPPK